MAKWARECRKKLIEAAVKCAKGEEPPPPYLSLAWECERYSALPESGGINDQDHRTMVLMRTMQNVYHSVKQFRTAKGDDIHKLPASTGKTIKYLIDIGIHVGGL